MAINSFFDTSGQGPATPPNPPQPPTPPMTPPSGAPASSAPQNNDPDTPDQLINYNKRFASAPPVLFRDAVIDQTIAALISKNKPNPLLTGAAGTGKTAIVETLAHYIATDSPNIPDALKGYTIYELPLSALVSGSGIVGVLEQKTQAIIDFISNPDKKAILYIDEVHQFMQSKTLEGVAQILKPALARGDFRMISSTTIQEAKMLTNDPAFNRRVHRILVNELTADQTFTIMQNLAPNYVVHYQNKVTLSDDALKMVVTIASDFKTAGSHFPDSALTLLDKSMSEEVMRRERQLAQLPTTQRANYAPSIYSQPLKQAQVTATAQRMVTGHATPTVFDVQATHQALSTLIGQQEPIETILQAVADDQDGLVTRTGPLTFLLAGPSGVGKTETVKRLAQNLTGEEPIILNMAGFKDASQLNRIIGSPPGYVGSDSNRELVFDSLSTNPYRIILLDEAEKAHADVMTWFMSVFETGTAETNQGHPIDFSKAIIMLTTNSARNLGRAATGFSIGAPSKPSPQDLSRALSEHFVPELLSRIHHKVFFNLLSLDDFTTIVCDTYAEEHQRLTNRQPTITLADPQAPETRAELAALARLYYTPEEGARQRFSPVRDFIRTQRAALFSQAVDTSAVAVDDTQVASEASERVPGYPPGTEDDME